MITGRIPIDSSTPAVVLKFDPNVMHHGGLGAIRSLGRLGVPVYGVVEGPWTPAARSRFLAGRLVWRPEPDQAERTRAGLRRLAEQIGRPAVLIPTDDAGAIFLAEQGDGLRDVFVFPAQPPALPRLLAGKHTLARLCAELGVASPRVLVTDSAEQARGFAAEVGFPVVAKQATPWTARISVLEDGSRLLPARAPALAGIGASMVSIETSPDEVGVRSMNTDRPRFPQNLRKGTPGSRTAWRCPL